MRAHGSLRELYPVGDLRRKMGYLVQSTDMHLVNTNEAKFVSVLLYD